MRAPVASASAVTSSPADDQRLLVGERQVDPLAERRHRRAEAGGADERVQDEVGAGLDDQAHETLGAAQDLPVRPGLRRPRRGVGVRQRDPPDAELAGLLDAASPTSSPRRARPARAPRCARRRRAPGVPIEPVEPRINRRLRRSSPAPARPGPAAGLIGAALTPPIIVPGAVGGQARSAVGEAVARAVLLALPALAGAFTSTVPAFAATGGSAVQLVLSCSRRRSRAPCRS